MENPGMNFCAYNVFIHLHFKLFSGFSGLPLSTLQYICAPSSFHLFNLQGKNCQTLDKHSKHSKLKSTVLLIVLYP